MEWLELSEEEREGTIAPMPFDVTITPKTGIDRAYEIVRSMFIPARYDLREHINIKVKNQMGTGMCWAFADTVAIETNLALRGKTYDFSETHMEYETSLTFRNGEINETGMNREINYGRISCYCLYLLY